MLRVGLTGELGSGKSTVARFLEQMGAVVLSSDAMGRALMQPGQAVYRAIVEKFGPTVVLPDGTLDRPGLARLAFDPLHPRVDELNAIVHPAVLAEQERRLATLAQTHPEAVVIIESALIFTVRHDAAPPWKTRFDRIVLVTAPEEDKIARFIQRAAHGTVLSPEAQRLLREDALGRLAAQRIRPPDADVIVLRNDGGMDELQQRVRVLWRELRGAVRDASLEAE